MRLKRESETALIHDRFVKVLAAKKIPTGIAVAYFVLLQTSLTSFAATIQPATGTQTELNQPQTDTLTKKNSVTETASVPPVVIQTSASTLDFLATGTLSAPSLDAKTQTLTVTAPEPAEVVPPSVTPPPETVNTRTVTLGGTKAPGQSLWVSSNGGPYARFVAENTATIWSAAVNLVNGANDFRVIAVDASLNTSAEVIVPTVTYSYTVAAPTVTPSSSVSDVPWTVLSGMKATGESIWISSNGGRSYTQLAPKDAATTWSASVKLVSGANHFTVLAKDPVSAPSDAVTVPSITYTVTAPAVTPPPASVASRSVILSGNRAPGESIWVSSDGGQSYKPLVTSGPSTTWSARVDLVSGDNYFAVLAEDAASNTSGPVTVPVITCTSVAAPTSGNQVLTFLQGPTLIPAITDGGM